MTAYKRRPQPWIVFEMVPDTSPGNFIVTREVYSGRTAERCVEWSKKQLKEPNTKYLILPRKNLAKYGIEGHTE